VGHSVVSVPNAPQAMGYADVVQVFQATDCPEAHSVAQQWLEYLALRDAGVRLFAHAIYRDWADAVRKESR
jgi:hypothetical protein